MLEWAKDRIEGIAENLICKGRGELKYVLERFRAYLIRCSNTQEQGLEDFPQQLPIIVLIMLFILLLCLRPLFLP